MNPHGMTEPMQNAIRKPANRCCCAIGAGWLFLICGSLFAPSAHAARALTTDLLTAINPPLELQLGSTRAVLANISILDTTGAKRVLETYLHHPMRYALIDEDRYGRAQILLYPASGNQSIQEILLQRGFAINYATSKQKISKDWQEAETQARDARHGDWAKETRMATPETANQAIGQFAIIRGTITNLYRARGAIYLNFGERWQEDFSVKIPRKQWRSFQPLIARIASLLQTPKPGDEKRQLADPNHPVMIQARGSVISDNGPMIIVTKPEQLEILPHANP